jgi:hypothetical protein
LSVASFLSVSAGGELLSKISLRGLGSISFSFANFLTYWTCRSVVELFVRRGLHLQVEVQFSRFCFHGSRSLVGASLVNRFRCLSPSTGWRGISCPKFNCLSVSRQVEAVPGFWVSSGKQIFGRLMKPLVVDLRSGSKGISCCLSVAVSAGRNWYSCPQFLGFLVFWSFFGQGQQVESRCDLRTVQTSGANCWLSVSQPSRWFPSWKATDLWSVDELLVMKLPFWT